jgi:DNA-directed RNA polymerase specialized sigma24 family protein
MIATPAESAGRRSPGNRGDGKHNRRPAPREDTGQAITGADVRAALAGLAAEDRQVIIEIYYHKRSVCETADLLCVPVSTVASRAYTAVRHLPRGLTAARELARPALCRANPIERSSIISHALRGQRSVGVASQLAC